MIWSWFVLMVGSPLILFITNVDIAFTIATDAIGLIGFPTASSAWFVKVTYLS